MIGTLLLLVAAVSSQDTHYCPDGWKVSEIGDKIECIWLSGLKEKVTKADAAAICSVLEGWLVDMDEGHGPQKNNLLKSMIVDKEGEIGHHGGPGMQWEGTDMRGCPMLTRAQTPWGLPKAPLIPVWSLSAPAHDNILLILRTWKGWTRILMWN